MEHIAENGRKFTSVAPLPSGISVDIKIILEKAVTHLGKILGVNTAVPTPFQPESCW